MRAPMRARLFSAAGSSSCSPAIANGVIARSIGPPACAVNRARDSIHDRVPADPCGASNRLIDLPLGGLASSAASGAGRILARSWRIPSSCPGLLFALASGMRRTTWPLVFLVLVVGCNQSQFDSDDPEMNPDGPGTPQWGDENVSCSSDSDCNFGEACAAGVCQMKRC